MQNEILSLFQQTGALLRGHFILRSGLHSRQFFQCAKLLQHPQIARKICIALAEKLRESGVEADFVISPALGGILVGHEIAAALNLQHIFAEKEDNRLVLRRFEIKPGTRFIIAEDVVTKGGRLQETLQIVRDNGGIAVAACSIVDRSGGDLPDFGCPFISLLPISVETFTAEQIPSDLKDVPAIKPGSK